MKKNQKTLLLILFMLVTFVLTSCSSKENNNTSVSSEKSDSEAVTTEKTVDEITESIDIDSDSNETGEILVVYFSATGNTKAIAEYVADALDADLYEITPREPYTEDDLNYNDSDSRANEEQNDDSSRPEISSTVENMDQYETVIIGHPIWWGEEPRIIDTFIESYDFSGKTMTTFCTSASSGIETSVDHLQSALPDDITWFDSKRFEIGADQYEVESWLTEIGLIQ